MTTPKYRTDTRSCSCPGYWYRRTCKHYRAYREAVALVEAQDKANKAYPPIPANLAGIGEASTTMRGKRVGTRFRPSFTPITDTGQVVQCR